MSMMERQRSGEHRSTALGEHYCYFRRPDFLT